MRAAWHAIWGSAHGPAMGLLPHVRILVGFCFFLTCMIAPTATWIGASLALAIAVTWSCICWPHWHSLRPVLSFGMVALLSYAVAVMVVALVTDGVSPTTVANVLSLLVGGASTLLVSVATITALGMSDLREGCLRLPVPKLVTAILLQIIHQTATLAYETRRIASAMAVRGSTRGGRVAWKLVTTLPRVWLPRIVRRADRVAAAMELRGYCDLFSATREKRGLRHRDLLALGLALGTVVAASLLRVWRLGCR
jgi:energy-coupling factor transporter transmembrane protein EcfT